MLQSGKNELERFVDKYGYEKIWTEITERLLNGVFVDADCMNFKPERMFLKFTRDFTVGCCFEFDTIFETWVSYTDNCDEEQYQPKWFIDRRAAEVDNILISFEVIGFEKYLPRKALRRSALIKTTSGCL